MTGCFWNRLPLFIGVIRQHLYSSRLWYMKLSDFFIEYCKLIWAYRKQMLGPDCTPSPSLCRITPIIFHTKYTIIVNKIVYCIQGQFRLTGCLDYACLNYWDCAIYYFVIFSTIILLWGDKISINVMSGGPWAFIEWCLSSLNVLWRKEHKAWIAILMKGVQS